MTSGTVRGTVAPMPESLRPPREDLPEWAAQLAALVVAALAHFGYAHTLTPETVAYLGAAAVSLASGIRHALRYLDRRRKAAKRAERAAELAHARAMYRAQHGLPPETAPHAVPRARPDDSTPVLDLASDPRATIEAEPATAAPEDATGGG